MGLGTRHRTREGRNRAMHVCTCWSCGYGRKGRDNEKYAERKARRARDKREALTGV